MEEIKRIDDLVWEFKIMFSWDSNIERIKKVLEEKSRNFFFKKVDLYDEDLGSSSDSVSGSAMLYSKNIK